MVSPFELRLVSARAPAPGTPRRVWANGTSRRSSGGFPLSPGPPARCPFSPLVWGSSLLSSTEVYSLVKFPYSNLSTGENRNQLA